MMRQPTTGRQVDATRRALMTAALAAGVASVAGRVGATDPAAPAAAPAFDFEAVVALARAAAAEPHEPRIQELSGVFADLSYDDYRAIRVRPEARLWRDHALGFEVDLLPPGSLFRDRVAIHVVEGGVPRRIAFDPATLDFGAERFDLPGGRAPDGAGEGLDWTGFRLRAPINAPDVMDEFAVFQGASYFRGVARDQVFGTSARALAIRTGAAEGEEFPAFTAFWLRAPEPGDAEIRFHALLESESVVGAYDFTVQPGGDTTMIVACALFPRVDLADVGLAPLTSMFLFDAKNRGQVDDFREAVHDSDGLQMVAGSGERVWRPLLNPPRLQFSTFVDRDPKGFGLAQRARGFEAFEDAEARYDKRPSAWVAPSGRWGAGGVGLVEIPTETEFNDNIVAFWRPDAPLKAGEEQRYDYALVWSGAPPDVSPVGRVRATRAGRGVVDAATRLMVVDFEGLTRPVAALRAEAEAHGAELIETTLKPLPAQDRARVVLRFAPPEQGAAEFRLRLVDGDGASASETWLHRWIAR